MAATTKILAPAVRSCRPIPPRHCLSSLRLSRNPTSHPGRRTFSNSPSCLREKEVVFSSINQFQVDNAGRFGRFEDTSDESAMYMPRNPMNYIEVQRRLTRRNQILRKRIVACCSILGILVAVQIWMVSTFGEKKKNGTGITGAKERLDAPPGTSGRNGDVVIMDKPGVSGIKVDEFGIELVETGTSSIPHFPRKIQLPSSSAEPAATPTSPVPGVGAEEGFEEYTLLGLGIRTVSFLSVQVYVLGLYVRTTDLDTLQTAFVKHVNPNGSSLIPSEKDALRTDLMSADAANDVWNKVLQETHVRSCFRIVPTRGTDFNHLRDGWVRGITARTQELSKRGIHEFEDEAFGKSMTDFKALMSGRGKAPKGSTLLLTRDEHGTLGLMYEPPLGKATGQMVSPEALKQGHQKMGQLADERISRQVWLGYLGGKNVSSEGARESIVNGIIGIIERPIGTVSSQVL